MGNADTQDNTLSYLHPTALWGITGVLLLLINAVVRLTPLALQPLFEGHLAAWQWLLYALTIIVMAYSEGYRGFQLAFAPRVVARAIALRNHQTWSLTLFAPLYCMGLVYATRRRMIVSWSILTAVVLLVVLVRLLPYPYRSIVDAGVVVGLSWGIIAILGYTIRAALGTPPDISADLPTDDGAPEPVVDPPPKTIQQ
ncbi:MAG: hypothetical protein AAFX99_18920 [Myxococcota bacterium]